MLCFDYPQQLGARPALERLLTAAPSEGLLVSWPDGAPTWLTDPLTPAPIEASASCDGQTGEVVAPSPLGPVRARFCMHADRIAIEVLESPRFVPDQLVRAAMEAKLERALA